MLTKPLRPDAGTVEQQIENSPGALPPSKLVSTSQALPLSGAQKFHVPLRFETADAMTVATNELAVAQADRDSKNSTVSETRTRVARMEEEHAKLANSIGSSGTFGISLPNPARIRLELEIAASTANLPTAEQELAQAEQRLQRWQDAVGVLKQLAATPEDPNPYVAALVCDRIPKSPNPDPALFM